MSARAALLVAIAAAVLAVLVVVGRAEDARWADDENTAIAEIRAEIGDLDEPGPVAFREHGDFRCLAWRRGDSAFALELCYESSGRVIEALDRRNPGRLVFGSLRAERSAARTRVDARLANHLFELLAQPR